MRKILLLLLIIIAVPLLAQPAYGVPAILTDDISIKAYGVDQTGATLYIGNGLNNPATEYASYLQFTLPEVGGGGNFEFHFGMFFQGTQYTSVTSTAIGVYVVPDNAAAARLPISNYFPASSGYWSPSNALTVQPISSTSRGTFIYFDFTIPVDSPYYSGLQDGTLTLALAIPYGMPVNNYYYFSSMSGAFTPTMDYVDPPAVPEPNTLMLILLTGPCLAVFAGLKRKIEKG